VRAIRQLTELIAILLISGNCWGKEITGVVTRVIEGDTIVVNSGTGSDKVRLAEIDAPGATGHAPSSSAITSCTNDSNADLRRQRRPRDTPPWGPYIQEATNAIGMLQCECLAAGRRLAWA